MNPYKKDGGDRHPNEWTSTEVQKQKIKKGKEVLYVEFVAVFRRIQSSRQSNH